MLIQDGIKKYFEQESKSFFTENNLVNNNFWALFLKLVCSDICIKNNVMKSDSIIVNETKTLFN